MKRKRAFAVPLFILALLACLSGCSDYALSQSQLDERLAEAREDGYSEGYDAGRNEAEDEHYNDYDNGYRDGYDRGRSDTVSDYEGLLESCRENYYQYGYDDGYKAAGGNVTPQSSTTTTDEPATAIAMPQPDVQTESAPTQETAPTAATYDYIINTSTGKFHYTWCKSVSKMSEQNKWYYTGTRDSVINTGYVPCKNCNP